MLRRFDPAGALIFSVCGLFCGQSPNPKFQASQKVMKNKVKPPFSTEKSGFRGAAGRIRTADLILTKRPKHILRSTHSSLYVSCNPCAARVFGHVISRLVPFCPLRFYLIPAICWKNVGTQMFRTGLQANQNWSCAAPDHGPYAAQPRPNGQASISQINFSLEKASSAERLTMGPTGRSGPVFSKGEKQQETLCLPDGAASSYMAREERKRTAQNA